MRRLLYTAGPGNAFAAFRAWKDGQEDEAINHVGHSTQLFRACAGHGYNALVTSSCPDQAEESSQGISITYRPDPTWGKSGLAYHRALSAKAQQVIKDAMGFRADLVLIHEDSNPRHYARLMRQGIKVVQILHTRLWPEGQRPSLMQRMRLRDFGRSYRGGIFGVISASDAISRQVHSLGGPRCCPIVEFLPLYRQGFNADIATPDLAAPQLDIAFISAVEPQKGALDLIGVAQELAQNGVRLCFHICGTGTALDQMQQLVRSGGLSDYFAFHGPSERAKIKQVLAGCQVTILPTRRDLNEGFDQIAVESILAGRPVVISNNCPAMDYIGESASVVASGDLAGYARALQQLSEDRATLIRRAAACNRDSQRFQDEQYSLGAAVEHIFAAIHQGTAPMAHRLPITGPR